jgi:hypothetical protein
VKRGIRRGLSPAGFPVSHPESLVGVNPDEPQ